MITHKNGYIIESLFETSLLPVELIVHRLHGLHQLLRVLALYPLPETGKFELSCSFLALQPLEVVHEHLIPVLLLEDSIDQVAAEQLQLYLTAKQDVLVYCLVGLGKYMTYH